MKDDTWKIFYWHKKLQNNLRRAIKLSPPCTLVYFSIISIISTNLYTHIFTHLLLYCAVKERQGNGAEKYTRVRMSVCWWWWGGSCMCVCMFVWAPFPYISTCMHLTAIITIFMSTKSIKDPPTACKWMLDEISHLWARQICVLQPT